ncbi:MAG: hypothetical protein LQ340_000543 [Diploschistes diacapsis]|nr:MAG: hypothetical protein LQ340_000543 [Diploschistes diacapsis]
MLRSRSLDFSTKLNQTEAKYVIFTDDSAKRFEDFVDADIERTDDTLGIKYEKQEIYGDTVLLLQYNCPDPSCDMACRGWPDLHRHVRHAHHKMMCDLCTRNKKVFTHEHELFTQQELRKHEKFGDDNPGAVDQSGFKGHPECGFCARRFYGDDELYVHCRDAHEKCHICERQSSGGRPQYYLDYNALEKHYAKDHFLCLEKECLDKKFVVFASQMDLKAHQLEAHPNGLSKDARRDARIVDISNFDYRTPYTEPRGGRRGGRGRGRDPNAEPLPASSAQPLRRDELAYQRGLAVQSSQSPASGLANGTMTLNQRPQENRQVRHQPPDPMPQLENLTVNDGNLTPQEQARRIQHNAVLDRASNILKNDPRKITEFRNRVSSYRNSAITASEMIDSFFTLFDCSSSDLGKLIKELADIYENETKKAGLLKAWHDWRAIHEDYPSLPGPSSELAATAPITTSGGRRILKLKSSTAQSSRSAANREVAWAGVEDAPSSSSANPFPSLASASRTVGSRAGAAPWKSSTPSQSLQPQSNARATPSFASTARGPEAFPALPATAKPSTHMVGLHHGAVKWDSRSSTPANPWASGGNSGNLSGVTSGDEGEAEAEAEGRAKTSKKGKKGKQTVMMKWG